VENRDGHSVVLLPCECCEATAMTVDVDAARVHIHVDDIEMLEQLRDAFDAAIEHQELRAVGLYDDIPPGEPRCWQGHAPAFLLAQFDGWMDDWLQGDELSEDDILDFSEDYLPSLSACTDPLPCDYCDKLNLPHGSTYADAVEALRLKV
jgi:hypothetical protein